MSWNQEKVDYNASGPHQVPFHRTVRWPDKYCAYQTTAYFLLVSASLQIILQASPISTGGSFALDDVHIIRDRSCDDIIPTTTPNPPTTTTSAPSSPMDCTFENGDSGKIGSVNTFVLYFCKVLGFLKENHKISHLPALKSKPADMITTGQAIFLVPHFFQQQWRIIQPTQTCLIWRIFFLTLIFGVFLKYHSQHL